MLTDTTAITARPRDVLFVLPPDVAVPAAHLSFRFPPLGPAVVAACVPRLRFHALDLALELHHHPDADLALFADDATIERHLEVRRDERVEAFLDRLAGRMRAFADTCEYVAISVDRGSQISFAAAFSVYVKERWDKRVIVGGVAMHRLRDLLVRTNSIGADIVTTASTPMQIRRAFDALEELPKRRRGSPIEPNDDAVVLVRGGLRKAPSPLDWPMPDFSIYDLRAYRRDALRTQFPGATQYRGEIGESLVLPYFFTFECQFSCAFCQTGGTQEHKPIDDVVLELAQLSERWQTREFLFFDTQINLHARALAQALIDARLDLRFSDSYRVRPSEPGDLELLARAGCASLTIGVESASEKVLKAMIKGHRPEQATETIREAHRNEILLRVNLLACYPGETRDDFQATCDWVRENAFALDDIAPSSFYLTADSPLGRKPERYGIRIRGPRKLEGEGKFRKSPDSLAYDEIDGLTWEEREPLLAHAEDSLRHAWIEGRGSLGKLGGYSPSTMLGLRRRFSTKAEINEFVQQCHDSSEPRESPLPPKKVVELPATIFRPVLIAPRNIRPPVARMFAEKLRLAQQNQSLQVRHGDLVHALLFADGGFLLFRGSVTRTSTGLAQALVVDRRIGDPLGIPPDDPRALMLIAGANLDLRDQQTARGLSTRFEVITFRADVEARLSQSSGVVER